MVKVLNFLVLLFICQLVSGQQNIPGMLIETRALYYKGNTTGDQQTFQIKNNTSTLKMGNVIWECKKEKSGANETQYVFKLVDGYANKAGVSVNFKFTDWSKDNYVIMPSAVYSGNRFDVLKSDTKTNRSAKYI